MSQTTKGRWLEPATVVTVLAATIATVFSAHGMITTSTEILRLDFYFALVVAGFLEMALISAALHARKAMVDGRSGGTAILLTWFFSAVSGAFSALHQIITTSGIHLAPHNLLGASIRIAPPLVASALWHFVLVSERYASSPAKPRHIRQRERLMREVALNAFQVRALRDTDPGATWRLRLSTQRLQRAQKRLLAAVPATDPTMRPDMMAWMHAAGATDMLPELTAHQLDPHAVESFLTIPTRMGTGNRALPNEAIALTDVLSLPREPLLKPYEHPTAPQPVTTYPATAAPATTPVVASEANMVASHDQDQPTSILPRIGRDTTTTDIARLTDDHAVSAGSASSAQDAAESKSVQLTTSAADQATSAETTVAAATSQAPAAKSTGNAAAASTPKAAAPLKTSRDYTREEWTQLLTDLAVAALEASPRMTAKELGEHFHTSGFEVSNSAVYRWRDAAIKIIKDKKKQPVLRAVNN